MSQAAFEIASPTVGSSPSPRQLVTVAKARLDGPRDRVHRRHRLDEISPTAVSSDSMSAEVPSSTAFATSLASARVGSGAWSIDSSICVAVITGRAPLEREEDHSLLEQWHGSRADLDARVAARDHHRVGRLHDRPESVHGLRLLDLRDDTGPPTPRRR